MQPSHRPTSTALTSPAPGDAVRRPAERLRRRSDFEGTLRRGRRARGELLQLAVRRTDGDAVRIGLAVSARVGGAVVRNRLKRRLRMIARDLPWTPGIDAVLIAKSEAVSASIRDLERDIATIALGCRALMVENR